MKWESKPRSGSARCSPTLRPVQLQAENRPAFHAAPSAGSLTCIYTLAHTVPWQDISIVKAEAVAKSFFQNTL